MSGDPEDGYFAGTFTGDDDNFCFGKNDIFCNVCIKQSTLNYIAWAHVSTKSLVRIAMLELMFWKARELKI